MKYFAYGSNMLERRLCDSSRVPSAAFISVGVLSRHKLFFHKRGKDGSGKCNIVLTHNPDDMVLGIIFDINDEEIAGLDAVEGVSMGGYSRRDIVVDIGTDALKQVTACTYFANPEFIDDTLLPFRWYKALVIAGALEHDLPGDYVRMLHDVPDVEDPNVARRDASLRLLGRYLGDCRLGGLTGYL